MTDTNTAEQKYDLHCHSTASDGSLPPTELVQRAADQGVTHLAITDHDTVAGYADIDLANCPLTLIPGIELSTSWRKINVHIVGLGIDIHSSAIHEAVTAQQDARLQRAELIAEKLRKRGFDCELKDLQAIAGSDNIGRPHIAQHLINIGAVENTQQAFKKYLGAGKPGDVKQHWADMAQVIEWIRAAGGIAVLAHPLKYKMTRTKLIELVTQFTELGGQAMEAVSGKQIPSETRDLLRICEQFDLLASCGSDFHHPGLAWSELGNYSALPSDANMVYSQLGNTLN